jgi:hypothetical protein
MSASLDGASNTTSRSDRHEQKHCESRISTELGI